MNVFRDRLAALQPASSEGRAWIYVPYDQLHDRIGPLSRLAPEEAGIVLVESLWRGRRRPYHKQKLALVLANQRHFALEQAQRGVAVRYVATSEDYASALRPVSEELGALRVMRPAERELRVLLGPLVRDGRLVEEPHEGWLTTEEDFAAAGPAGGPWRMDAFYRAVRRRTGILMDGDRPVGGKFSFDAENREFWPGEPPAPDPPAFEPDDVTLEVVRTVRELFADHPGEPRGESLPATRADAERLWAWAVAETLASFGPYEDAMSTRHGSLFHTRVSGLLNLHRLLPADVVRDVVEADIPLNSKEGLLRQILGWREFVRHVHEATDGFRSGAGVRVERTPGSARWQGVTEPGARPDGGGVRDGEGPDGGAAPSFLGADRALPAAYWGRSSGLACLDHCVAQVLDEGWTHHIPRLMVLANLATLLDVSPRELTDWFWVAFVDAFDWVVEPNVLAMGTFGTGEVMTTKPYVSGAAYIDRMSDFCSDCRFHPKKSCPITPMYWAFLERHRERLADNRRMAIPLASVRKRSAEKKVHDREVFEAVWRALAEARSLEPDELP